MESIWIDVKESLPTSVDNEVLVQTPKCQSLACYWSQMGVWVNPWGESIHGVTHWTTLENRQCGI